MNDSSEPMPLSRQDSLLDVSIPEMEDSIFSDELKEDLHSIGELSLRRSNRADLRHKENGSIHAARLAINKVHQPTEAEMAPVISSGTADLMICQKMNAKTTFEYYQRHPGEEAFCHEHAEMVLHKLNMRGKGKKSLLLKVYNSAIQRSHIFVIYANVPEHEAIELLKPLAETCKTAPFTYQPAGMNLKLFAEYLSNNAPKLFLIDAWSSTKVLAFRENSSAETVSSALIPLVMEGLEECVLNPENIRVEALRSYR